MSALAGISFVSVWVCTFWSFGDAAEAPSGPPSPCDGHPCGPPDAAECKLVGKGYKCVCKEGYRETHGGACIPQGPCGTYPCGPGSERCLWVDLNKYRCKCKEGYGENSLVSPVCTPVHGMCGTHPCGFGGLCIPTPSGGYTCECADGFTLGPSTKGETCNRIQKTTCENERCGDASIARCVETANSYFCVCREGATPHFNDFEQLSCKKERGYNPCHEGACGDKGVSCVFNSRRSCTCEPGYIPKPVNLWNDERCYPRTSEDTEESETPPHDEGSPPPQNGDGDNKADKKPTNNTMFIAGGIVGAVLLLGAISAGVGYRHFKSPQSGGAEAGNSNIDFEGRDAATAQPEESDVLINARNEDWAH